VWLGCFQPARAERFKEGTNGTDVVRSMAERAGATITEVEGSHVIMVSQPGTVAEVIMTAAAAVGRPAAAGG
jgi:hypothetical protein